MSIAHALLTVRFDYKANGADYLIIEQSYFSFAVENIRTRIPLLMALILCLHMKFERNF